MKTKTRKQVETAKRRAVVFTNTVLKDYGRADEIAEESIEDYARRKRIRITNPLQPQPTGRAKTMATKQDLEQELNDAYERIDALESYIAQGADLLPEEDEETDEEDDEED